MHESQETLVAPPASDAQPESASPLGTGESSLFWGPEEWTPERLDVRNARFVELRKLYPDRYVAYRERWDGDRLVEPFVLAVADTAAEVERVLSTLPPERARDAVIDYQLPANRVFVPTMWVPTDENGNVRTPEKPSA